MVVCGEVGTSLARCKSDLGNIPSTQEGTMFKVGDCVILRSGSPRMTVTRVGTKKISSSEFEPSVQVIWFDNGFQREDLHPETLVLNVAPPA
jgi:uncharacterized protein YodC (DUF2158 family)